MCQLFYDILVPAGPSIVDNLEPVHAVEVRVRSDERPAMFEGCTGDETISEGD